MKNNRSFSKDSGGASGYPLRRLDTRKSDIWYNPLQRNDSIKNN